MRNLRSCLRRFLGRETGAATVEFVLIFPVFMAMFLNGFEAGYYMVRNVMLERAVDVTVRDVRLARGTVDSFDGFRTQICANVGGTMPDCTDNLMVELIEVPDGASAIADLGNDVTCLNKTSSVTADKQATYTKGAENKLMVLRVCALTEPLFPTTTIGMKMGRNADGDHAIIALSSFVIEPT